MGLEFKDFNFDKCTARIERTLQYQTGNGIYTTTPKTESSRRIIKLQPFIIDLVKQLKVENAAKCKSDWLFVQCNGEPIHPNTPYTWLERFCKKENLPFL